MPPNPQYKEFLKSSASFNHKLVVERKSRLPFLDSQTGVAQSDCCLWVTKRDRQLPNKFKANNFIQSNNNIIVSKSNGKANNTATSSTSPTTSANANNQTSSQLNNHHYINANHQQQTTSSSKLNDESSSTTAQDLADATLVSTTGKIYSYPAKWWLKRKRQYLFGVDPVSGHPQTNNLNNHSNQDSFYNNNSNSTSAHTTSNNHNHHHHNHHNHHHHHNVNNDSSLHNHDSSFMHDSSSNSNACPWTINEQSKDATTSSKIDPDESTCEASAPDLDDSLTDSHDQNHHSNNHQSQQNNQHQNQQQQPNQQQQNHLNHQNNNHLNHQQSPLYSNAQNQQKSLSSSTPKRKRERKKLDKSSDPLKPYKCDSCEMCYKTRPGLTYHKNHCHSQNNIISNDISPFCDFCLGDAALNKRTNKAEELISCSDCGRSGHPTCQGWKQEMIDTVKNYKWQCIECKSCGYCGTSDNDAQLLICDDCDRGYHTYCLNPPLEKVDPNASWSCSLCKQNKEKKLNQALDIL